MSHFGTLQKELIKRMVDDTLIAPKNKREEDALARLRARGFVGTDGLQWKLLKPKVARDLVDRDERETRWQRQQEQRLANMHSTARKMHDWHTKFHQLCAMNQRAMAANSKTQMVLLRDMIVDHIAAQPSWFVWRIGDVDGPLFAAKAFIYQNNAPEFKDLYIRWAACTCIAAGVCKAEARAIVRGEEYDPDKGADDEPADR